MKTFTVLGGDYRSTATAKQLSDMGFIVKVYALGSASETAENMQYPKSLQEAIHDADYILLPLPCSSGNGLLNTPLSDEAISLLYLAEQIKKNQHVFGGKMDKSFCAALDTKGIRYDDYAEREEFSVLNAIPTAEGAIEIALREMPCTLNGLQVLVTGFGRIAKVLAHMLQGMGAKVTVAARKPADLAWMKAYGYHGIHIQDIKNDISHYGVIFNTIPHTLFDRETLAPVQKDCLIIDLASKPGGVDFTSAQNLGVAVIWALSLPGKCAPLTAGRIVGDTVLNILRESEVKA
ncbi:MAG: dipicolinate synthase subunit DpsA [Ruminococcaceae bacterium]|nr:dipicolinate synthase subunit DpsA [Oscillospiraceae bacterium]